jgi:hypothetical protein
VPANGLGNPTTSPGKLRLFYSGDDNMPACLHSAGLAMFKGALKSALVESASLIEWIDPLSLAKPARSPRAKKYGAATEKAIQ